MGVNRYGEREQKQVCVRVCYYSAWQLFQPEGDNSWDPTANIHTLLHIPHFSLTTFISLHPWPHLFHPPSLSIHLIVIPLLKLLL